MHSSTTVHRYTILLQYTGITLYYGKYYTTIHRYTILLQYTGIPCILLQYTFIPFCFCTVHSGKYTLHIIYVWRGQFSATSFLIPSEVFYRSHKIVFLVNSFIFIIILRNSMVVFGGLQKQREVGFFSSSNNIWVFSVLEQTWRMQPVLGKNYVMHNYSWWL